MNKLQTIAIFLPSIGYGGAEMSLSRIANYLAASNINVHLIVSKRVKDQLDFIDGSSIEVEYLNSKKTLFSFFKLYKKINKIKPDILFSTLPTPNFLIVLLSYLKLIKAKVIIREANSNYINWKGGLKSFINKKMAIFAFNNSHGNIFISSELKNNVSIFIKNENNIVIYNPVFFGNFHKLSDEKVNEFKKTKELWLTASRIEEQKGLNLFFDIVDNLKKEKDLEVLVIGAGSKLNEYKEKYSELPITFLGNVKNPLKFMKIADVFVFPSLREGLGNSLIEAQILGLPIISSDCPSGPKEIVNLFSNGILFESGNKDDFLIKAKEIRGQQKSSVSKKNVQNFDIQRVGKRYLSFFESILN